MTRPSSWSGADQPSCYCWLHANCYTNHSPVGRELTRCLSSFFLKTARVFLVYPNCTNTVYNKLYKITLLSIFNCAEKILKHRQFYFLFSRILAVESWNNWKWDQLNHCSSATCIIQKLAIFLSLFFIVISYVCFTYNETVHFDGFLSCCHSVTIHLPMIFWHCI